MDDNTFIDGLRAFPKHQNAPDFIMADISIEREVLSQWLANNYKGEKYIKCQLKMSRDGNPYIVTNDFKPQVQQTPSFEPQPQQGGTVDAGDIPFMRITDELTH